MTIGNDGTAGPDHARDALRAAITGQKLAIATAIAELLRADHTELVVVRAALWWIDVLFAVDRPPAPAFVPDVVMGATAAQLWALKLVAARANGDAWASRELLAESLSGEGDVLVDRLSALLSLVAIKISGRI